MREFVKKHGALLFTLAVIAALLLFYTAYDKQSREISPGKLAKVLSFQDMDNSLREFNKVAALAGIGILAVTFLLGPISRMFSKVSWLLVYRKNLGLLGFFLVVLHGIYSAVVFYKLDFVKAIYDNPKSLGFVTAIVALLIFIAMAVTSTKQAVAKMGYGKWKMLQKLGYVGLFLSVIHFVVLETKAGTGFDVRPFALLFLFLPVLAILLRLGMALVGAAVPTKYEHHTGEEQIQKGNSNKKNK